jgi:two-component system, LytTR family, response regulator
MAKAMIKTVLIDDEKHALESLKILLERHFPEKFEILAMCNSVDQALPAIEMIEPELVFLDIQMPQKHGFTLLEILPNRTFEVIFITAHQEHAINAISHDALAYLLKPIDSLELQKAIAKFENKRKNNSLNDTLSSIKKQLNSLNIIDFNTQESILYVDLDDILYFQAEGNYTRVYMEKKDSQLLSKPIGYFEKRLEDSNHFIRIHHSYLANATKFDKYDKKEGYLILKNGSKVSVSVRKGTNLKDGFF